MLNPFFLQGSAGEQGLIQDLINEQLRMYGIDIFYLPRKYLTEKTVIKEVIESVFNESYPIEAYIENYEGYGDNTVMLSKFGIQALNELTITVSKERFENYIVPLIKEKPNIKLGTRPREGDLVYFPLGDRLFEVKFVEHEQPFYQLQKTYVYTLKCELFRYEDEVIDTGISEIDDNMSEGDVTEYGPSGGISITQTLTMVGLGSTATATTTLVNGGIRFITVTNRGGGYSTIPRVGISSAPSTGLTGIATAIMIEGIVVCNDNINPKNKSVQSVQLKNPGFGYTVAPKIKFIGGGGSGAAATSTIGTGLIGPITLTNVGSGYTTAPSITFSGVSTVSASATAVVNQDGTIAEVRIINSGLGYTQAPTITISSPSFVGIGTYEYNEVVTGSTSNTTARVRSWNSITNSLEVSNVSGSFVRGENIVGSASSASYVLLGVDVNNPQNAYADNSDIETEADNIIDFTESNPFGMP
jgi:Virus neck protein